ncbi:MAG: hypothetical protein AABZ60_19515 [Planctomycetota bacterium]
MFRSICFSILFLILVTGCSSTPMVEQKPIVHEITSEQLFQEALALHEQKEYPLAVSKYGEVLQKDSSFVRARIYQAGCQFELGKFEEAQVNVAQVMEDTQFSNLSTADRADTLRLQGQLLIQQAQKAKEKDKQALLRQAETHFDQASVLEER